MSFSNHGDFDVVAFVVNADMVTALPQIPELDKTIILYPNPVSSSEFHVLNKEPGRFFRSWRLVNSQGEVLSKQRITQNGIQNLIISSSNLSSGVYFLQIETNRGITYRRVSIIH
jgi:hypothetical protein